MTDQPQPPVDRRKLSLKRDDPTAADTRLAERLHKVLAQAGLGSRRALEQRIADGLIRVNGEVAQVGSSIKSGDKIELDGRSFVATALTEPARVLLYNKPEGEVTTREDPEGRPTIFESLPALKGARWIGIGRLDINTTGLLLLSTDGELANALMHPSAEVEREYVCRVRAPEGQDSVPDNLVDRLARGVALEDGPAKFDEVERVGGAQAGGENSHDWFRVVIREGRNREVRRLWESQGCQVSRLKRVRYGRITLPRELLRGQSQELPPLQVAALKRELGLEEGPSVLTLQPVIGQRKASKSTVQVGRERREGGAWVTGHSGADEGRELRRFDHVREDRGRFGAKPHGGLTVSGEAAAKQANRSFKPKGPRPQGQRLRPGEAPARDGGGDNPAAMRTWYVPDGVNTGPSGHQNPDGARGPRKPYGARPGAPAARGPGAPRGAGHPGAPRGPGGYNDARGPRRGAGRGEAPATGGPGQPRGGGPRREGGFNDQRGPRGPASGAPGQRQPRPYGHPGNAPSFPSDHANPGSFNPYGDAPRGARPGGRPGGPRPAGPRGPGGPRGPRGGGGQA